MRREHFLLLAAGALLAAASRPAPAKDLAEPVNKDRQGVALSGYDPVAYFRETRPVKGSEKFTHSYMGATWRFASAENRDLFAAIPENYAPQFGGFCSWAVSHNYTAEIDPEAWKIVEGKLYLNYNKKVQKMWEEDLYKYIGDGNRNWPGLHR